MSGRVLNAEVPCPLPVKSGYVTVLAYQHVNQLRSSAELWRPGFYCGFITSACLIKSLTLCLNSAPSLLSSCGLARGHCPLITCLVLLVTSTILKLLEHPPLATLLA